MAVSAAILKVLGPDQASRIDALAVATTIASPAKDLDWLIARAVEQLDATILLVAGQYDLATAYLVLHWIALIARGAAGATGPIIGQKVGEVSQAYGTFLGLVMTNLQATVYGSELRRLIRQQGAIGFTS